MSRRAANNRPEYVPLIGYERADSADSLRRSAAHYESMRLRRSVRSFSPDPVPRVVIENCIKTAGTAPSGAHQQPWHFVVVESPETKARIRAAAEKEERAFYEERATEAWLQALRRIGTDENKPFLETAPYLVVLFAASYGLGADGTKTKHYYVSESVGIAAGFFIAAVHQAGLVTLTHTPSPMGFLGDILGRPKNERAFLLLPVGYPAQDTRVPNLDRKPLSEIMSVV